jgi:hypothetical protein
MTTRSKPTSAGRAVSCLTHRHASHLIPVGHSGRRKARTPDAHTGRRRPDTGRSDARTGHRTPITWTGSRGHRTLAPDTDADRATTAQPASGPPGPPRRATACWTPNRVPALALPGSCWVARRARPRLGALLSSEDYGSSVERAVKRQVLWRVHLRVAGASAERRSSVVNFGVAQAMAAGRSTVQVAERRSDETLAHAVDGAGALLPETMAGTTRATHSPAQTAEEILRHAKRQRTSDAGH